MSNLSQTHKRIFFWDPANGSDQHNGLSPEQPWRTHRSELIRPGDTILIRRGSILPGVLHAVDGVAGAPVTYSAYGEGEAPMWICAVEIGGDPAEWEQTAPSTWRFRGDLRQKAVEAGMAGDTSFSMEPCNLVFNGDEHCGNLRWTREELRNPGEWFGAEVGRTAATQNEGKEWQSNNEILLCAPENPAVYWQQITCVLWGERRVVSGKRHLRFENLQFGYSGVHGYQEFHPQDVRFRNCAFRFIGGAGWNREQHIRFGNALEIWAGGEDIYAEHCLFDQIFDSGVTHQGGKNVNIPQRIFFRHNIFRGCGIAAYECREPAHEIYFEHNLCLDGGGGFSPQGNPLPRETEHPDLIGHHVIIWMIKPEDHHGNVFIRNNTFGPATAAAIHSCVEPECEQSFITGYNHFDSSTQNSVCYHWNGRDFTASQLDELRTTSGIEQTLPV